MAKSVFYSFHYERDSWRVQQVMNMGRIDKNDPEQPKRPIGQPLLNSQEWETIRRKGDQAIEKWIDEQMKYKKAVIVLIGAETANRPWVQYEIEHAWKIKKPLLGIKIHGLKSSEGRPDHEGPSPFTDYTPRIPVFDPTVRKSGKIDTKATREKLKDNLLDWSSKGVTR